MFEIFNCEMGDKSKMEQEVVEKELSVLVELTLRLEDELNEVVGYARHYKR